jgi:hypothetical protein
MKKSLLKISLLLSIGLFMTSCFSTQQSCGLAQAQKTIKKAPLTILDSVQQTDIKTR